MPTEDGLVKDGANGACGARIGRCGFGWPRNRPEESVREPVCFGRVRSTVGLRERCACIVDCRDGLVVLAQDSLFDPR